MRGLLGEIENVDDEVIFNYEVRVRGDIGLELFRNEEVGPLMTRSSSIVILWIGHKSLRSVMDFEKRAKFMDFIMEILNLLAYAGKFIYVLGLPLKFRCLQDAQEPDWVFNYGFCNNARNLSRRIQNWCDRNPKCRFIKLPKELYEIDDSVTGNTSPNRYYRVGVESQILNLRREGYQLIAARVYNCIQEDVFLDRFV